jgi:type IV pilus assembly protein PilO
MALELKMDIENLSPAKKKLLLVLPPLIITVIFLSIFIMPFYEERKKLADEVEKQRKDIYLAQQKTVKLSALINENQRLKRKLHELLSQLPEEKEVSKLLGQVSDLGFKSGLEVILWKPQWNLKEKEKFVHPSKEVYEIPVNVEMRGSYHRFGKFFSSVTRIGRIVNLHSINMKREDQKFQRSSVNVLKTTFVVKTYALIPENERKEIEKLGKENKK